MYYQGHDFHLYHDSDCTKEVTYEEGLAAMKSGLILMSNTSGNTVGYPATIFDTGIGIQVFHGEFTYYIGEESTGEG